MVGCYEADRGDGSAFAPAQARKGLRIIDKRAQMAVTRAKPPPGRVLD